MWGLYSHALLIGLATRLTFRIVVVVHARFEVCVGQTDFWYCTQKQCSNWKRLSFLIIGHVFMDGTPVYNNRLVLPPFLNTLTVRASPSLSASQYPKDRKSCIIQASLPWQEMVKLNKGSIFIITICHPRSGYVTTKLHGTSTCRCNNNVIFSDRAIFTFPTVAVRQSR